MNNLTCLKSGSLVFVWGSSLMARIISWFEKEEIKVNSSLPNHVELYFDHDKFETIAAEPEGVIKTSLRRYNGNKYKFEVYSFKNLTQDQLDMLEAFAYGRVNTPYDFIGVLGILFKKAFGKNIQLKRANFCSELVADCFSYIGIALSSNRTPSYEQSPAAQWIYVSNSNLWTLDFIYKGEKIW